MNVSPALTATLDILDLLIGFDTTSSLSNLPLIDYVCRYLRSHGIEARIDASADGNKANLIASIGPDTAGGIMLSGHTDVVPVANQDWTCKPFQLSRSGDRLYGRGTADMKAFIAATLALVPAIKSMDLRVPIHIVLSYDEEIGCFGAHQLIDRIAHELPRPAFAVVGEPSRMQVINQHKGVYGFETTVRGREAHSSCPHLGANAIIAAGELVARLGRIARKLKSVSPGLSAAEFDPPYSTLNVASISGGTALNIIPNECRFRWEMRLVPSDQPDRLREEFENFGMRELLPQLRTSAPDASIETTSLFVVPALAPDGQAAAERIVLKLTGRSRAYSVAFGSEAGIFQRAGIPTVICGPGSIEQAHRPDEFIEISQISECLAFLELLVGWASDGSAGATH